MKYQYDALGRRIIKHAQAVSFEPLGAGSVYIHNERARVNKELGCGFTLYGWDGDTLAWEARRDADIMRQGAYHPSPGSTRTTHYLYEPNSFVPIAQGVTHGMLPLHKQPAYAEADYDIDEDPLWQYEIQPTPFDSLAWYQCDHLGTPQELTDQTGEIAWSAQCKAWGAAQEVITDAARKAGIQNPLRFQGQYFDHETGLHYNRHRYYDPASGRFISKDPIGLAGGINGYQYAPNPVSWIDPLGLSGADVYRAMKTGNDGLPIAEPTARGLGARPGVDIPVDSNGMVHPDTGGISVAPESARNLPPHRRPENLGGTGKDCACLLNTADLPKSLKYVQDSAKHGTIQPIASMSLSDYQAALSSTRDKWIKQ